MGSNRRIEVPFDLLGRAKVLYPLFIQLSTALLELVIRPYKVRPVVTVYVLRPTTPRNESPQCHNEMIC